MDVLKMLIPSIGSIIVSIITGFFSYYVAKNSDHTKLKIQNAINAQNGILKPLRKCLDYSSITTDNFDTIIKDIELIHSTICENSDNYFLSPPELAALSKKLMRLVQKSKEHAKSNWDDSFKKEVIKKYKNLQLMLYRFENDIRKETGCPENNTYQTLKFTTGTPVLMILFAVIVAVIWMAILIEVSLRSNVYVWRWILIRRDINMPYKRKMGTS